MLKFKKNNKVVGVLKDEASEPEGDAFKFTDAKEPHTEMAEQQEEEAVKEESE